MMKIALMRRLWEGFSIYVKLPALFLTTLLVSTLYFSWYGFRTTRDALFQSVDRRLELCVEAADALLPPGLIDRATSPEAVAPAEAAALKALYGRIADTSGVSLVYAMVRDGDFFRTIASSYEEYYTPYQDQWETLLATEGDGRERYDIGEDEYGPSRSFITRRVSEGGRMYFVGADLPLDELVKIEQRLRRHFLGAGVVAFFLVGAVSFGVARLITIPLKRLSDFTEATRRQGFDRAAGLDASLLPHSERVADEVRLLARNFNLMQGELAEHLRSLSENIAARERTENEMRIAGQIQQSLLPRDPPRSGAFALHGAMTPARLAGGDFYDYFRLDDRRLCFIIGDVSGKGMAAALFMATGLTFFRSCAREGAGERDDAVFVARVMARLDEGLADHNDAMQFITAIVGVLDEETGRATLACGGHNPPVAVGADGQAAYVHLPPGGLLGVGMGAAFAAAEIGLAPGAGLLLYTDGVTEARDGDGAFFGEPRLQAAVADLSGRPAREMVDGIMRAVRDFSTGREMADDVTVLYLRRRS